MTWKQDDEQIIVDFLRQEALAGRFESTTTEIANGSKTRLLECRGRGLFDRYPGIGCKEVSEAL